MASTALFMPQGFSYVAASLITVPLVLQWQAIYVSMARSAAKVEYPLAYAEKAEQEASVHAKVFNCRQRAHANTLENVPSAIVLTTLTGLRYPIFAACALCFWSLCRIVYALGYGSGNPQGRLIGSRLSLLTTISLLGSAVKVVFDLYAAGL
ncbi:membrane-associated proteins in eicosanoid and glutathione metabolism [Peniophora sp. CONT]|nr:membrane-associated proteins in eicosanoid and glutathione metabolism [Peniophora sp. CONT]